ncbi:MAG: FimV/HubP family polar landmark protein [Burkholderiales bacterium]
MKKLVVATAFALSGFAISLPADAAGLGRLNVLSSLGQPLRAEIELSSVTREEAQTLGARLASPEAFRQAGVDYNTALLGVRFAVQRRADGRYFINLSSTNPINEPFVDMLVELNWATGRLVREYTFLLDPAELRGVSPPAAAVAPPPAAPAAVATPIAPPAPPVVAAPPPAPAPAAAAPAPAAKPVAKPAPAKPAATTGSYEVKRGDTLGKIARQAKPDGVSLEQVLVALLRSNPDAFVGGNMNRLKSGVILNLPDRDAIAGVAAPDARRVVSAQSADWRAYTEKLAGTVPSAPAAKADAPRQAAQGRITARVEDKAGKGDAKDQLKLSKADPSAAKPKAGIEDRVAKERELRDAKARAAELEKNVKDLKKLGEVKNQQLAELQKQAQAKGTPPAAPAAPPVADAKKAAEPAKVEPPKAAPAPAPTPAPAKAEAPKVEPAKVEPAKPAAAPAPAQPAAAPKAQEAVKVEAPKAADPPKAPEPPKAAEAPKPADPPKAPEPPKAAEAPKPSDAPKAADAPKADASKPADAPKVAEAAKAGEPPKAADAPKPPPKKPAAPPPPPEPSLMDEFIDNPAYLVGGGGVLALLGGYAAYAVRRKRKVEKFENSIITGGDLKANSVFGNTGGQSVDTGNSSFQSDFSEVSKGSIDADEVDPVAEADVYMAYGRDAQAEEILKEALGKDATRHKVRVKLMEIYNQRGDAASFEAQAKELHAATGGTGDDWNKAAELGRALMPGNPLFAEGGAGSMTSTVTLPGGALAAATAAATMPIAAAAAPAFNMESTMQLTPVQMDAAGASPEALAKTASLSPIEAAPAAGSDLDFDIGGGNVDATDTQPLEGISGPDFVLDGAAVGGGDAGNVIDFDLGGGPAAAPAVPVTDFSPGGTLIMEPAGGDMTMDETQPLPDVRPPEAPTPSIDFDFDLSTDDAPAGAAPAATAAPAGNSMDFDLSGVDLNLPGGDNAAAGGSDDAATKLDLARAYQDMGDKEGARELLQEVAKEGSDAQKAEAQKLLSALG